MHVTDTFFSPACWRDELWRETRSPLIDIRLEDSNAGRLDKRIEGAECAYIRILDRVLGVMQRPDAQAPTVQNVTGIPRRPPIRYPALTALRTALRKSIRLAKATS